MIGLIPPPSTPLFSRPCGVQMKATESLKPFSVLTPPEDGMRIDLKSTKSDRLWTNVEVIGLGHSTRGTALWMWVDGTEAGTPGRVHAYMPVAEIEGWQPR